MLRLFFLLLCFSILFSCQEKETKSVASFKSTIVVPAIEGKIQKDNNVIYAVSSVIAWEEFKELAGGNIRFQNKSETADLLNQTIGSSQNIDAESVVAVAGFGDEARNEILRQIKEKFGS